MFGKDIDDFCAYVGSEMDSIKQKFIHIREKAEDFSGKDNEAFRDVVSRVNDLSAEFDCRLESLTDYCPNLSARSTVEYHAASGR
jgi:hypothetical protein